jgi:hypothetical protein
VEEPDVDVLLEDAGIGKWSILDTDCGEAVVHEFSHAHAGAAHAGKPWFRQGAQLGGPRGEPGLDGGSAFDCSSES